MKTFITAICMFMAINVNAATFSLVGGSADTLPNNWNDFNSSLQPNKGSDIITFSGEDAKNGEGVYLDGAAAVTFEYLGKEAGNENYAMTSSFDSILNTNYTKKGATFTESQEAGALDFIFGSDGKYTQPGIFMNAVGGIPGFWLSVYQESASSIILMFGDGFGDTDHDDMMVRATAVSEVPLPAAFWLFATGVAGFISARRKAIKAKA